MLTATEARKMSVHNRLRKPSTNRSEVVKPTSNKPPTISHSQGMTILSLDALRPVVRLPSMAKRRTIGNMIAPWRFLTFLLVLIFAALPASRWFGSYGLGIIAAFDLAALVFLILSLNLLLFGDPLTIESLSK